MTDLAAIHFIRRRAWGVPMRSLVSALVGLVLMLVAFPVYAGRMLTASSCSQVDVQTQVNKVIDNPDDPDTVIVPSGSCKWTDGVTLTRKSVIIKGAGSGVSGSPCPCTIITDGTASGSGTGGQFFKILLDANQKARVAHLQIIDGTADTRANGIIAFYSTVINPASLPLVRADHLKYTATSGTGGNTLLMGQNVLGVWDSN